MAGSLDELLRFLLDQIALSGQLGGSTNFAQENSSISFLSPSVELQGCIQAFADFSHALIQNIGTALVTSFCRLCKKPTNSGKQEAHLLKFLTS